MAKARQRDFRYIASYLKENPPVWPPTQPDAYGTVIGCLAIVAAAPLLGLVSLIATQNLLVAVAAAALGGPLVGVIAAAVSKRKAPKVSVEERHRIQTQAEAAKKFADLVQAKHLLWVDPLMLQLLEAAAYHHYRVATVLAGPMWTGIDSGQRSELKRQAKQSADEAMKELLVLAAPCIGKPPKERKDDLEALADDFVNLHFADALASLQRVASASAADYAFRSPHTEVVFPACRAIAERIKQLADELEKMPVPTKTGDAMLDQPASTHSLDLLVGELKAVREAEEELQQQRLNG